jgi:hypothetical protein
MKINYGGTASGSCCALHSFGLSEEAKPNFSGTWTLDKDRSDPRSMSRKGGDGSHGVKPRSSLRRTLW